MIPDKNELEQQLEDAKRTDGVLSDVLCFLANKDIRGGEAEKMMTCLQFIDSLQGQVAETIEALHAELAKVSKEA